MSKVLRSFRQSFEALLNIKMLFILLLPPLIGVIGLMALFFTYWQPWVTGLGAWFQDLWILQWAHNYSSLGYWMAFAFLILLFVPISFLVAVILTSLFVMPMVLSWVAKREFPQLEKKRGGSAVGSVWNALQALVVFIFLIVLSLPLWFLPGGQILVPVVLSAWLNKKVFLYDVLQDYASQEERQQLEEAERRPLYGMGMILGLLAYIPLAFFFIPVISALCYTYYGLTELRNLRQRSQ